MRLWASLLLAFVAAPAAQAQFELLVAENGQERPAPSVYNLGSFYINETATARFRLRNTSAAPATLSAPTVAGFGFVLSFPPLPAGLAPKAIDFSVAFRAGDTGSYSASLNANGISILLTTLVLPRLTYRLDPSQSGPFPGLLDFGRVVRGGSAQLRIHFQNDSAQALTVPAITVEGADFSLASLAPSGQILQPGQGGEFTLAFNPTLTLGTLAVREGALFLGDRTYPLTGTCFDPTPPKPVISIDLPQAVSAQQGTLLVRFDAPTQMAGTGTATISSTGPADSAILFANSGARQVAFAFAPGDQQVSFPFQTGTTAGALTFTVTIDGGATDEQTIQIPAAAPGITGMQTVRSGDVVELRIAGFDNTRSIGPLAVTFYDTAGNMIAQGVIRADASAEFARYFATSQAGVFLLRLAFPVSGDASGIASWEAALTNSAGSSKTARTSIYLHK